MEFIVVRHLFTFIFSFLLTFYFVPMIINAAFRFNILDRPDGRIKKHKEATPYLGGLAIYISFIATLAVAYPFENKILWLLLGVTFLLFVGLIDDMKCLKPYQKLFGQFIAVVCFLKGGFGLKANFFSDFFNLFTSSFWMILIINAFNLVDVMDGLSSVLAIVASLSFFIIAFILKQYALSILLLAFIGPLVSFLFYNKPPAKIYLGDAGSLFIGGFMAAIPLLFPWSSISFDSYYTPIVILGIPILEVVTLVVIRTYKGIPFFMGSPHHFSIYLKKKWSVLTVLVFSAIMSAILSVLGILFLFQFLSVNLLILLLFIFLIVWFYLVFLN